MACASWRAARCKCRRRECLSWGQCHRQANTAKARSTCVYCSVHPEEYGIECTEAEQLLRAYWTARGVRSIDDQDYVIRLALNSRSTSARRTHNSLAGSSGMDSMEQSVMDAYAYRANTSVADKPRLPGINTLWDLRHGDAAAGPAARASVIAVSQRVVELAHILGVATRYDRAAVSAPRSSSKREGEASATAQADALPPSTQRVAGMLIREPRLLTADTDAITQRVFELRIKLGGHADVTELLLSQPRLLLQDLDAADTDLAQLLPALRHGLPSDSDDLWSHRIRDLEAYIVCHGDAHCGFRDSDDDDLALWCKKQRAEYARGRLSEDREAQLHALRFEFDPGLAEWLRWYAQLAAFRTQHGSTVSAPYTADDEFYLTNWCSVQRIARRSRVLSQRQLDLLDELDFDWSGADPLS